ncbi:hypothetical protein M0R72_12925 [Candidatus Pacearchaeota archaeon]|jgi:Sec-independent protein secretion pathway component TatC|nr:hypothetical protein [Candidatus Pacearchaeota archaeon]
MTNREIERYILISLVVVILLIMAGLVFGFGFMFPTSMIIKRDHAY